MAGVTETSANFFPCALIDCSEVEFSGRGMRAQESQYGISVRVADMRLSDNSATSPVTPNTYAIHDLMVAVYKALEGLTIGSNGAMTRTHIYKVQRSDSIREFVIEFKAPVRDDSAAVIPMRLDVTVS